MRRSFNVYAFYDGDEDGARDQRRSRINPSRMSLIPTWIARHKFDHVLIDFTDDDPVTSDSFAHHVCSDSLCPGGCGDYTAPADATS